MPLVRSALILTLLVPGTALAGGIAGADAITTDALKKNIGHLASDALEGRGSGAKGGKMAAAWLAAECKAAGLLPAGENNTYFQGFSGQGQQMQNVVAKIVGTQPGEAIVIGAHYDHLGKGHQSGSLAFGKGRGVIHNGADDNASGTAAILEIAKAFKASGQQPKRTVIFMWFDGEERGLLGSKHWVKNPTENAKVVFMLNLDMVGRLENELTVYGGPTGDLIPGWMKNANTGLGIKLKVVDSMTGNSDHASFYEQGIPVLMPFTGLHGEYHRPGDDTHLIKYEGVTKIARFAYGVAFQAANSPKNAVFKKAKDGTMQAMMEQMKHMFGGKGGGMGDLGKRLQEMLGGKDGEGFDMERLREMLGRGRGENGRRGRRAATKPRLGVFLQEDGVTIRQVNPNTVAEAAGLQVDDTIVSFNGVKVSDLEGLRAQVAKANGKVEVVVKRGEKLETLTADFSPRTTPRPRRIKPTPTPAPKKEDKGAKWF